MNNGKLSINSACVIGTAFLGVISSAAIIAAYLLTGNPTIIWLGLLFVTLMFACVAAFVAFLRRKLVLFSDGLCRTIDDMLDGATPQQIYEEENLFYKMLRCWNNLCGRKSGRSFCRRPAVNLINWIFSCRP